MNRYLYTIINTVSYYPMIAKILKDKNKSIEKITDLSIGRLNDLGVHILVLDFDGVLNSHAEPYPREDVTQWLKEIQKALGAENIFILSNKPLPSRIEFFAKAFPGIRFIKGVRKKPYPDGLEAVFKIKGLSRSEKAQVALVDDRLLTGALATCIAGCQSIYVTRPYMQLSKHPFSELFFQGLRWLEHLVFAF